MTTPHDAVERLLHRPELAPGAVSPHRLERFLAGDLPAADAAHVRQALRADPALAAQAAALRADDEAFAAAHPYEAVGALLFARAALQPAPAAGRRRWFAGPLRLALPLVATLAALALLLLRPAAEPGLGPSVRAKGAGVSGWQLVEGQAEALSPGDALRAGDTLQLRVTTTQRYAVVLGMDGTGTVTRYLPVGGEESVAFGPGQGLPLPDGFRLDDAPGPEAFVVLLSPEPLPVADLEQALYDASGDGAARALLDADLADLAPEVHMFWVEKARP